MRSSVTATILCQRLGLPPYDSDMRGNALVMEGEVDDAFAHVDRGTVIDIAGAVPGRLDALEVVRYTMLNRMQTRSIAMKPTTA